MKIKILLLLFQSLLFIHFKVIGQENPSFNVMTYNIRYDSKEDNPNWDQRKKYVIDLIRFHEAGIIGVQEALHHQLIDMQENMPGHKWIGKARDDGKQKGEYSAIFYKSSLFEMLENNTFWLSTTPGQPSKSWDAALPRVCTWSKFNFRPTNTTFYVFNTHFDHIGVEARANSVRLLMEKIPEIAGDNPYILMGDFNFSPEAEPYQFLVSQENLFDAQEISISGHYGPEGTFNAFKFHEPLGDKIDHIFVNHKMKVLGHGVLTDSYNMHYPSDHLPVLAKIKFEDNLASSSRWENEINKFDQDEIGKDLVVFTGSSTIRLWPNLRKEFNNENILNRGFGGSEIQDIIINAERLIFRYSPKRIVIYSGDNDIWRGKSAAQVSENFKELFYKIRHRLPDSEIIFLSIKPSPSRAEKFDEIKSANNLISDFMKSQSSSKFVDVFNPMLDDTGKPKPEYFVEDMLHLNEEGYKLWAAILKPYLTK